MTPKTRLAPSWGVTALLVAVVTTGCGTTTPLTSSSGLGGVAPEQSVAGQATLPVGSAPATAEGTSVAGPGPLVGAHGGSTSLPGSAQAPQRGTPSSSLTVPATGPGWDEKYVYVGVVTQKDTQRVFASFGANNVDPGNTEQQALAAADIVNARGGILGRQVRIRFKDIAILETNSNPSVVGESVCAHFAQDARVVAVWNVSTQIDQAPTFRECLAKAHIPLFSAAARAVDDKLFADLAPYYYHALMVSWTRLAPVFVARLKAQGYFGGWNTTLGRSGSSPVRIGLLIEDEPQGKRTASALKRSLSQAGYGDVVVFAYDRPEQGQASSVQYFKGNGVTHVIVADVELTAFQTSATSQAYKPRYGITTYNAPYPNLEASGLTPSGANNGAVGVGWAPAWDVSDQNDPGATPGWPTCQRAMAKRAEYFTGKRLARGFASTVCDSMLLIDAGAEAGRGFTGTAIRSGIVSVASRFPLALGFAPAMGPRTPFAPGLVRDLAWGEQCGCMRYGRGTARI